MPDAALVALKTLPNIVAVDPLGAFIIVQVPFAVVISKEFRSSLILLLHKSPGLSVAKLGHSQSSTIILTV